MGNSCTRSEAQVLGIDEMSYLPLRTEEHSLQRRGRWSTAGFERSVDLDALVDAPSPSNSPVRLSRLRRRRTRNKSKSEASHRPTLLTCAENSRDPSGPTYQTFIRKNDEITLQAAALLNPSQSYSAFLSTDSVAILDTDADFILGSPSYSPSEIHARWGEPVDDPDETNMCCDFVPNPFKFGFCVTCQKQHDITCSGLIMSKKEFKKIARPAVAKTAANAANNPAALNASKSEVIEPRESDVDLALLLKQRRDILTKLERMQHQETKKDRTNSRLPTSQSAIGTESNAATLANLRIVPGRTRLDVQRTTATSGMAKSVSANALLEEKPESIWL